MKHGEVAVVLTDEEQQLVEEDEVLRAGLVVLLHMQRTGQAESNTHYYKKRARFFSRLKDLKVAKEFRAEKAEERAQAERQTLPAPRPQPKRRRR